MIRYLCPTCRQVAKLPDAARLAFCPSCGQALASFDRLFEPSAKETMPMGNGAGQAHGARLPSG